MGDAQGYAYPDPDRSGYSEFHRRHIVYSNGEGKASGIDVILSECSQTCILPQRADLNGFLTAFRADLHACDQPS